jgi:SAM-dependent methyltransferase
VLKVAEQVEYWNRVANEKVFSHPVRLNWLRRGAEASNLDLVILDYGCGYGRTVGELWRAGYQRTIGLDFSQAMLSRCRAEQPSALLVQSDGQALPLQAASVKIVLLFAVLTCIPHDDEQRRLLAEIFRVLSPGGLLYISDLLLNDDERNRARYEKFAAPLGCYGAFELPEGVVVRHHERQWIEDLTSSFVRLEFEPFEVLTMNGNRSAAFQYLGQKP